MAVSTYLVHAILDAIFNATAFGLAGNPYISLHNGNPGTTGANELSGGSYARMQVAFNASADRNVKNTSTFTFTLLPAAAITYIGVWDAASGGNFLIGGPLSDSYTVAAGGSFPLTAEHIIGAIT